MPCSLSVQKIDLCDVKTSDFHRESIRKKIRYKETNLDVNKEFYIELCRRHINTKMKDIGHKLARLFCPFLVV